MFLYSLRSTVLEQHLIKMVNNVFLIWTQCVLCCSDGCNDENTLTYCNGPLKPASEYCVKLRAYTDHGYADTPCSQSLTLGRTVCG